MSTRPAPIPVINGVQNDAFGLDLRSPNKNVMISDSHWKNGRQKSPVIQIQICQKFELANDTKVFVGKVSFTSSSQFKIYIDFRFCKFGSPLPPAPGHHPFWDCQTNPNKHRK